MLSRCQKFIQILPATITEGQREENAEDINACPQITNDPAARRQRIMEWEERGRFPSKEEWQ